jgi:hypothetical protein
MTTVKMSDFMATAENRRLLATSIRGEYESMRIPIGSGWLNAMNSAGVNAGTATGLSSEMQTRIADAAQAYTEAAHALGELLKLFNQARAEIYRAASSEDFIID